MTGEGSGRETGEDEGDVPGAARRRENEVKKRRRREWNARPSRERLLPLQIARPSRLE
jgi:hypothetical protein